jgi:8-oxo-dGTP pyrophosphatase MutT (NUDIX family)
MPIRWLQSLSCCLPSHASAAVAPAPPPAYEWVPRASLPAGEGALAPVTSCFTAVLFVPRATPSGDGLAAGRASRGYAFRLGNRAAAAADPCTTLYKAARATSPRLLLAFHARGGLELPGGKREGREALPAAAARELREETGAAVPLAAEDVALVRLVDGAPRWALFLSVTHDAAAFDAALGGLVGGASSYPLETWGLVGVPLTIEGANSGFPRALAAMPPWQAEMLLPLLVHRGVLTEGEAREVAAAAHAYLGAGGLRKRRAEERDVPLPQALEDALARLRAAAAPAEVKAPPPGAAEGGGAAGSSSGGSAASGLSAPASSAREEPAPGT